jgi:MSHA biogenesis protein MshK
MSIINDALKKVHLNLEKKQPLPAQLPKQQPSPSPARPLKSPWEMKMPMPEEKPVVPPAPKSPAPSAPQTPTVKQPPLRPVSPKAPSRRKTNETLLVVIALLVCVVLLAMILLLVHEYMSSRPAPKPAKPVPVPILTIPAPSSKSKLVINGIMDKGGKNVALINNEIYEVGETVNGMTITKISLETIEFVDSKGAVKVYKVNKK